MSSRARDLIDAPQLAPYILTHFERLRDEYGPERPDGYIGLCIAENRLMWPELSARLGQVPPAPDRVLGYDAMIGALPFRERLAAFLSSRVLKRTVAPEHVAAVAGAGSALELLFYALGDSGDSILVPTPSYAGFWPDLQSRDGLRIVTVPTSSQDGFQLTEALLDRAMEEAPSPVRGLLFTNPDNPLGRVRSRAEIERVLKWAEKTGLHVVFDEIYALSVFGASDFTSVAELRPSLGDRLHIVWAFSKDFGASGLRAGVLVTENEAVMKAVDALAYWSACSGHTQHLLGEIIADTAWLDEYLLTLRSRLKTAHAEVVRRLQGFGVSVVDADGGIFVVCDLRPFLSAPTFEAEHQLWQHLVDQGRVNITPGSACRIAEPGFFRLCWATMPLDTVRVGLARMEAALATRP